MKNLSQGQTTARTLALSSFTANYGTSGLDKSAPVVNVSFSTNSAGQTLVGVTATATIRTFFMRLLPQFQQISVANTAQATRGKLIMTVVLDRSASMKNNGGSTALPSAVTMFVNLFDNANDEVAMVSFASHARVDVAINYNFKTPITNAVNAMPYAGGTFGPGGLTLAQSQNDSVTVLPGQNVVKVVLYFTDGYANEIQDTFLCPASTVINYGGYDSGSSVDAFDPTNGTDWGTVPTSGTYKSDIPYTSKPDYCKSSTGVYVKTFYSQQYNAQQSFTRTNVTAESVYRALQTTTAMRTETIPTYIYSIGLGNSVDQAFLKQIANDPASTTYNPNQPVGMAQFVPNCPSTQCTAELQQVFLTIASRILLRLTQ
jgi:Mg-chelatase subunit ChlD